MILQENLWTASAWVQILFQRISMSGFKLKINAWAYLKVKLSNKTGSSGLRSCFKMEFVTIKSLFDQLIQKKKYPVASEMILQLTW